MSDVIDLNWIGATLRSVQAEQRSIRTENALIRSALSDSITVILQRIGNFEALVETRMDRFETLIVGRVDLLSARMDSIEAGISTLVVTLNRIEGRLR
jgi:hypothetical protein